MMQGDQYRIPIQLKHENGDALDASEIRDIEVFVGDVRHTMKDGGIDYSDGIFYFYLMQKESFRLRGNVKIQARIVFNSGDVVGVDLGIKNVQESVSKVVLA